MLNFRVCDHVSRTAQSMQTCFRPICHLRRLRFIRRHLGRHITTRLYVLAFVLLSRLYFCTRPSQAPSGESSTLAPNVPECCILQLVRCWTWSRVVGLEGAALIFHRTTNPLTSVFGMSYVITRSCGVRQCKSPACWSPPPISSLAIRCTLPRYIVDAWSPHLRIDTQCLEAVQPAATVLPDCWFLVSETSRQWTSSAGTSTASLCERRLEGDLIKTYKMLPDIKEVSTEQFFQSSSRVIALSQWEVTAWSSRSEITN